MTYINIPSINYKDIKFDIVFYNDRQRSFYNNEIIICESMNIYISNIKKNITQFNDYWDIFKKITNPYEYIHSILPNHKFSICKYKPISRSFFKMIEIINTFNFLDEFNEINSFHLAEGPGGFIEAFNYTRNNKKDRYYGITLISNDQNIPSWKKANHLLQNTNIKIEYGKSKDGDLFKKENLDYLNDLYGETMNYITADGGFDFSVDFNSQEELSIKLIFTQIIYAIILQKQNGNFIIKLFDIFKIKTIDLLFLLSNLYDNIYIYKPNTSRIANSEKYVICRGFRGITNEFKTHLLDNFDYILNNVDNIYSFFNIKYPKIFLNKLQEINAIYGQQQIENINTTLNIIREFININNKCNLISNDYNNIYKLLNFSDKSNSNYYSDNISSPKAESCKNSDSDELSDIFDLDDVEEFKKSNQNITFIKVKTKPINIGNSPNIEFLENIELNLNNETDIINNNKFTLYDNIDELVIDKSNNSLESKKYIETDDTELKELYTKYFNKLNIIINVNIQKSINWCKKYNFSSNKI